MYKSNLSIWLLCEVVMEIREWIVALHKEELKSMDNIDSENKQIKTNYSLKISHDVNSEALFKRDGAVGVKVVPSLNIL